MIPYSLSVNSPGAKRQYIVVFHTTPKTINFMMRFDIDDDIGSL